MTQNSKEQLVADAAHADDPYHLTPQGIKQPPQGWASSLRHLGPGLIVSASIVGSGELIATTALGAEVGFVLLWLVIVSVLVEVALQVEMARWAISTGEAPLTGINRVPPRIGRVGWINILYLVNLLAKLVQYGGIVGGVAAACSILLPIAGPSLGFTSLLIWTIVVAATSIALLYSNRYSLVERGAIVLVMFFAVLTLVIAAGLVFTPFSYGLNEIQSGLTFRLPVGAVGAAVAMFGLVGVNADEVLSYNYWCVEKGYARWTGPADGSDAWVERANGWIRVMYKDVFLSLVVYTFGTIAFFIMGAAVLHPQGLVPQGNEMVITLSRTYTDVLGAWANVVFLIGAIAVLGSTLWAGLAGFSRMYTNLLATLGVLDWNDARARVRCIRIFTVALPVIWGAVYLFVSAPVVMIQISGVVGGIFLPALVVAIWRLRNAEIDRRLHGGALFNILLVISSVGIALLGAYSVLSVFGFTIG